MACYLHPMVVRHVTTGGMEVSITVAGGYTEIGGFASPKRALAARSIQTTSAEKEFLELAKMSPVERIRYTFLKSRGLTEDDLKGMTPEQREAIETAIAKAIEEVFKRAKGVGRITDLLA